MISANKIVKWILRTLCHNEKVRNFLEQYLIATGASLAAQQARFAPAGHYYSPLPNEIDIESAVAKATEEVDAVDGVCLNVEQQLSLLRTISGYKNDFDWPKTQMSDRRYWQKNLFFVGGDAIVLFGFLKAFSPKRILEIGSGFSSALMLDYNQRMSEKIALTFVDPNPERLISLLTDQDRQSCRCLTQQVQSLDFAEFARLEESDILFIDSSHVSKAGSDVNYLLFEVLPRLKPGVLIHIHDVFYPFEYPVEWLEEGRSWNEAYLIRSFLQYNQRFEVLMFNDFLRKKKTEVVQQQLPLLIEAPGASLWLRAK